MKTDYRASFPADDMEIDDLERNRFNGVLLLLGLLIPLIVCVFLLLRSVVDLAARKIYGMSMEGKTASVGKSTTTSSAAASSPGHQY